MKKIIFLALLAVLLVFCLAGCGKDDPTLIFMVDGTVFHEDVLEEEGELFAAPKPAPEKEGYYFGGWFYDDGTFKQPVSYTDLNTAREEKITHVYAKWEVVALQYEEATRSYTVTGLLSGAGESVSIPAKYGELPITAIAPDAFRGNTALTTVTIPDSITKIGDYAFAGCTKLKEIVLPHTVKEVGKGAFSSCVKLESVRLSAAMTEIVPETFYNCISLRTVNIPAAVKTIGYRAFSGCTALTELTLPAYVRTLAGEIFRGTAMTELRFAGTKENWATVAKTDFAKESSITVVHCTNGDVTP